MHGYYLTLGELEEAGLLLPSASPSSLIWISLKSSNPMEKSSWVWNLCLTLLGQRCLCSKWQSSNEKTPNFKYYQLFTNNFILKETWPAAWQPHCKALFKFSPWSSILSIQGSGASESHSNVHLLIPGLFLRPMSSAKAGLRFLHGYGPVGADPTLMERVVFLMMLDLLALLPEWDPGEAWHVHLWRVPQVMCVSTEGGELLQELIKGWMFQDLLWSVSELFFIVEKDKQTNDTDFEWGMEEIMWMEVWMLSPLSLKKAHSDISMTLILNPGCL